MNKENQEYEECIERYNEQQAMRHLQALQRQRMMSGGYTDEEVDDFDEEEVYGII